MTLSGFDIPAGTFILLPHEAVCTNEANFPNPDKYQPERFLRSHEDKSTANPFTNLHFGYGKNLFYI